MGYEDVATALADLQEAGKRLQDMIHKTDGDPEYLSHALFTAEKEARQRYQAALAAWNAQS